jgi:cyclic beta-1,2-glucan synthetase
MPSSTLQGLVAGATPALCSMLEPSAGLLQAPIRSEIFGLQRFAQHGRSLGETHRAGKAPVRETAFFPRLRGNIGVLREAHRYIGIHAATGYDVSPAGEWLLDNFHLIESQLKEIHEGLPRSYFRTLPVLLDEPLAGLPRVYGVAWAFVAHTDGAFDEDLLIQFLSAYQETRELKLSEMWALPTTLRVVLIENLRRLAERVAASKAAREVANLCCDRIETCSEERLDRLLVLMNRRGVGPVFLAQMAQRFEDRRTTTHEGVSTALQDWMLRTLPDQAAVQTQQRADQAADNLSVSNAVTSLRAIGDADWPDIVARTSALMRLMLTSAVFASEHATTRDQTLHGIEVLARRSGRGEVAVANTLLDFMRVAEGPVDATAVPSYWLHGPGRHVMLHALGLPEQAAIAWIAVRRVFSLPLYLGALLIGTLALVAWALPSLHAGHVTALGPAASWCLAMLAFFPASETVVAVVNRLISESARPQHLPRLAFLEGVPIEHRVMVVIPAMLNGAASTIELVHRLQLHYLANPERHAQFALLSDWADAEWGHMGGDQALLARALQQIGKLNALYPRDAGDLEPAPRFILLHRDRHFSHSEQRWIGWERKRGKLELLLAALAGNVHGAFLDLNEASRMAANTRYVVTLDSDTQLPPGRLRALVGVAAHPHNQPRLDATGTVVVGGYGILQPRIATPLPAPRDFTLFHWLFAGQCGIDPYSAASSEIYQDLFQEGTFTGKGLLNVQAMHAVLGGRLPDGKVLSHDLLEGSMARCAVVTDILFIEDAPFHADVAASRVHRWTRGDWQLLPFLFNSPLNARHFRLRAVNRWKMFDNLRRSLVAPMSLAMLLLALAGCAMSPWAALALVIAAFCSGPVLGAMAGFLPTRDDLAKRHFYGQAATQLARALLTGLWNLAQLLPQALMSVDAIVRALYRMAVSHRLLLQWTTAEMAQAAVKTRLADLARTHWSYTAVALLLMSALALASTPHLTLTLGLCMVWAASPLTTWWVSRPHPADKNAVLPARDQRYLEGIARDTWRFFEHCIGADDHHLPPDNLQVLPQDMLAHRTSPTNIGLYLLSVACARQFGWIGTQDLVARIEATLATLATLQRHRGHFMNWYDTQTCAPLLPMYVSTVDSGNLSGHLLAVAQACIALARAPHDPAALQRALLVARQRLAPMLAGRAKASVEQREQLRWCLADHRATLQSARRDEQASASGEATHTAERLRALAHRCEALAWEPDFSFVYHRKRHLFHIGFRVAELQLDAGYYDLLASESRLTSLLAIAKGDVPVGHWCALGRPFYAIGANAGLRSWSGSMFEYLMPGLVLDEPYGSVLYDASHAALQEQFSFVAPQGVPWGISESAYAGRDHTLAYQYAPQGVPRLALRRTPPHELVIAPYATALAAQCVPHRAAANLRTLEALGARGHYGFIEALDFTPARQVSTELFTPVCTFMAHHQGMSLAALANTLLNGVVRRWAMSDAHIEAMSSLLHERAPREVSTLNAPPAGPPPLALQRRAPGLLREVLPGLSSIEPTHLLSNGRYNVTLRANGAGASRWGQTGITRERDDALRDACGSFCYVRWQREDGGGTSEQSRLDRESPGMSHTAVRPHFSQHSSLYSITQHPAPDPAAQYRSLYHADRVCFDALWPGLQAHTTVWVSPEDDIEFRKVELSNLGEHALEIELISAFEVTLSDPRADEAHPAFTNLFVSAQWHGGQRALVFARKPRLPTEQGLQAAHFLVDGGSPVLSVRCQTDRQRWLGRNRAAHQPQAVLDPVPADATDAAAPGRAQAVLDTGLDPMCALAVRVRIAPGAKAQLTFCTAASDNTATLHAVIDKYRQSIHVQRASLMSATLTGIRLRALGINAGNFAAAQTLATALVLSLTRPQSVHALHEASSHAVCDRQLLWRFGISGDRPLILVSAGVMQGLGLLRSMAQALRLWSWGGIACDLVVVNAEPASYLMALHRELGALRERHMAENAAQPGTATTSFHVLRAEELSPEELSTLQGLARVRIQADGRPMQHHVQEWSALHEHAFAQRQEVSSTVVGNGALQVASTSRGAFDPLSGEFSFDVGAGERPSRPWINVLANDKFGAHISEAGGGYTWAVNSRLNQLTAWSNDPVSDTPGEWFLIQDRKTMETWSVAPSAWGDASVRYHVVHGQGHSVISHRRGDLQVTATWCVDPVTSVKQVRLRLINLGHRPLSLRVVGIAEWMMGANRADRGTAHTTPHLQRLPLTQVSLVNPGEGTRQRKLTALMCTQRERSAGFGQGTAFLAMASAADDNEDWTCDRRECFDARGRLVLPDRFGKRHGAGLDPCAALASELRIAAYATSGEAVERVFLLGYAQNPHAARQLCARAAMTTAAHRMEEVNAAWEHLLGATQVKTPDPLFNVMVNRWLLYQTVSCRMWAKAGFYQAGGATGFRDQMQDAMALAWTAPAMLREQIVVCASRQFTEGDVQHWWHAPTGAGVRTRFSDDLLWLPHACAHYLRATGDATLLDQSVPFIEGAGIAPGAEDAYYVPVVSTHLAASVYEHAARTIDRSIGKGVHGLPLMGSGDWNDGMNRVGIEGRGESVWLGWFLCRLVADFAPLARTRGDEARALRWETAAVGWKEALLTTAWDGQWFKRAFFDDGSPLGSRVNAEARIDLIAQAWSVLADMAPPAMREHALHSMDALLVDQEHGLIRLLDPPFAHAEPSAGYIQAYPPGVRENGGQYSHAGVWALMAQASQHAQDASDAPERNLPYQYFKLLSPAHRCAHDTQGAVYGIEPYVMAGDVYSQAPHAGRGGWSWYTGAAAWMHRGAIESIFGLHLSADALSFSPCLPLHWQSAELTLARDGRTMRFILMRETALLALEACATLPAGSELQGARSASKPCSSVARQLLMPGATLAWSTLPADTTFVVPLL